MVSRPIQDSAVTHRKLGRPADTDSSDTRERIVMCACERFAAEGFEGTTNKDIADRAKVSSAALYHYFPSKADIYIAVCDSITESLDVLFTEVSSKGTSLEERMVALFDAVARMGEKTPAVIGFITGISAVVRKHPEVARGADTFGRNFSHFIIELISGATESKNILNGVSVVAFADLTGTILGGLGRMSARGSQERHVEAAHAYLQLIRAAARN